MAHQVRIVQRQDGAVFTWTPQLDAMPNMIPGWMTVKDDGTREIQLDQATARELDPSTVSQRERRLIEENAKLRQMLASLGGAVAPAPAGIPAAAGTAETPLPPVPEEVADLTAPPPPDEEPIQFQPEPPHLSRSKLAAMNKDDIAAQIRILDRTAIIPDGSTKVEMI